MGTTLPADDVHVGPSDYVPWLTDRKWAHIRLEGEAFGNVPLNLELKLEVWDSPNSAGIVIDAVRCCKLALDNGITGQLDGPSSYLMKSPMNQRPDNEARELTEKFIAKYARAGRPPPSQRSPRPAPPESRGRNTAPSRQHRLPPVTSEQLSIAQVTPFAWEVSREVNDYVAGIAHELSRRGHRVLIIAPSESGALVRDSRREIRNHADTLLERADGEPLLLGVGEVLPFSPTRRRAASLPVDVARTIEEALADLRLDLVHVHEPFAPSASSIALRHSRGLNVGSFHAPTERILSTQLTGPLSRLLFGRLDARTASYTATRDLLQRYFLGDYRVILPGADVDGEHTAHDPVQLLFSAREERGALRIFLRTLRALPADADWRATVWSPRPLTVPATLSRALRERVEFVEADRVSEAEALAGADVLVLASEGIRPAPGTLVRALAGGVVPVASRLPVYEELLGDGEFGFMFEPGDAQTLASHLNRLIAEPGLRRRGPEQARELRAQFSWSRVADEYEEVFAGLLARRHDSRGNGQVRARLASRRLIDVDLHMHTDHSYDCATPVEVLLAEAQARGLGAIAVTDHNEIGRARGARPGHRDRGDRRRGGQDRRSGRGHRAVHRGEDSEGNDSPGDDRGDQAPGRARVRAPPVRPSPFRPRLRASARRARRRRRDRGVQPAGGDQRVQRRGGQVRGQVPHPSGRRLGRARPPGARLVRIRMRQFDGPEEFLESLRDADIVRKPASLLYVQALKFLQTKALPEAARRASRERRVRRATGRDRRRKRSRQPQLLMHSQGQAPEPSNRTAMPATDERSARSTSSGRSAS